MKGVAQRYASALAGVTLAHQNSGQMRKELAAFLALYQESADLRTFLASPAVPRPAKQGVIEQLVARMGAGKTLRNFLLVILENRRSPLLPQIQEAFEQELLTRLGVGEAEVVSARTLTAAEQAALVGALERITGKRIEARYQLDPGLIGGAVVRIGSTIYDGSVREQLSRLRARLASE